MNTYLCKKNEEITHSIKVRYNLCDVFYKNQEAVNENLDGYIRISFDGFILKRA